MNRRKKPATRSCLGRIFRGFALLLVIGAGFIAWANVAAVVAAHGRMFSNARDVPEIPVAMVLGTSPRTDGRMNLFFRNRIAAAAELWKSGKIKTVIVSGDKDERRHYDEPEHMRRELIKLGVPEKHIVSHNSGYSTLDSVLHAKQTFSLEKVIFVSQQFHNERAIYLASKNGIDAYGFNARDVTTEASLPSRLREIPARVKMWLDANVLHSETRIRESPVEITK